MLSFGGNWLAEETLFNTSLAFDREEKIPLYAAAGIPETWLVDLAGKILVTYRRPEHGVYTEVTRHRGDARVSITSLPDTWVAVGEIGL